MGKVEQGMARSLYRHLLKDCLLNTVLDMESVIWHTTGNSIWNSRIWRFCTHVCKISHGHISADCSLLAILRRVNGILKQLQKICGV